MNESCHHPTLPAGLDWQATFLKMLPAIQRHARRAFQRLDREAREEATQAVIASTAIAYARLAHAGKADLGFATSLARYGVMQYRAGRLPGGSMNSHDVGSIRSRVLGCRVEPIDEWSEALCDNRHATPADVAALRVDFADWYRALSTRDRKIVNALASGERTGRVAAICKLTAGRVSQLRRELYDSWREFIGESLALA